jgi:uncharacterized membrane protein
MIATRTSNLLTQNVINNITNHSNTNIKPPNTERDRRCSCFYDLLYCRSRSVFGGLMFVLLWLVILSITFCVRRFDVRVAMICYIVHHVLCLEVWCSCCYDWLYCRSRSVLGGLMFVLLSMVILSITFGVWRFDVRVAMIGYIVDHVLCLEVWCSCCYHWLYCRSRSVFGVIDNITNHSNTNIKPPNTERDRQYNQS